MDPPTREFALIERMVSHLGERSRALIGDDAAVLPRPVGNVVAAADLLIQGRHFDPGLSSPADAGYKAIAVNISDIAAMGAVPTHVLVSLGCPSDHAEQVVDEISQGIAQACEDFGVAVAGGDTVGADLLVIGVTALGETAGITPLRRSGARPGHALCVTGALGAAAAGLALFRAGAIADRFEPLLDAHRRGKARVREGRAAARREAGAMIDISDGLVADLGHVCRASGVGAVLDPAAVPRDEGVDDAAAVLGLDPVAFALAGGDDYELVVTVVPDDVEQVRAAIAPTPLTVIGHIDDADGIRSPDGARLTRAGWDHFA